MIVSVKRILLALISMLWLVSGVSAQLVKLKAAYSVQSSRRSADRSVGWQWTDSGSVAGRRQRQYRDPCQSDSPEFRGNAGYQEPRRSQGKTLWSKPIRRDQ